MSQRKIPARSSLAMLSVAGLAILGGSAWPGSATPATGEETLILLLADGPLAAEPAPAPPPVDAARGELIRNAAVVPGVTIQTGLLMRPLYADSADGRSFSLVEWPSEVSLRRHWHPVTERLWMIEGSIASPEDGQVGAGMFWEAPARIAMGPFTSSGAVFAFLGEGPFETHYLEEGEEAPRAGATVTVRPDTLPWRPLAEVVGSDVEGRVKLLSPPTETDRAVYLLSLTQPTGASLVTYGANLEGYVLSGTVRLADPYHGVHLLAARFYFRIPADFPFSLSAFEGRS